MKLVRSVSVALSALTLVAASGAAAWNDTIENIMEKGFKKGGLRQQIGKEFDKDKPDWAALVTKTKDFKGLVEQLGKQQPPKGDAESWKTHTMLVLSEAQTLCECAEKKDQSKAKATVQKINDSCKACHDAHRE